MSCFRKSESSYSQPLLLSKIKERQRPCYLSFPPPDVYHLQFGGGYKVTTNHSKDDYTHGGVVIAS